MARLTLGACVIGAVLVRSGTGGEAGAAGS